MAKEVMGFKVWRALRTKVLETLDDLAYWQGRVDCGIEVPSEFYLHLNKYSTQLDILMNLATIGYCAETQIYPRAVMQEDVYKWLRIDYENSYTALYESCKKRFSE